MDREKLTHRAWRRNAPGRSTTNYRRHLRRGWQGASKRPLGDLMEFEVSGVNLTTLEPGAQSALKHRHHVQDEFVYVVSASLCLCTTRGRRDDCRNVRGLSPWRHRPSSPQPVERARKLHRDRARLPGIRPTIPMTI
jgi:hypothetical protein